MTPLLRFVNHNTHQQEDTIHQSFAGDHNWLLLIAADHNVHAFVSFATIVSKHTIDTVAHINRRGSHLLYPASLLPIESSEMALLLPIDIWSEVWRVLAPIEHMHSLLVCKEWLKELWKTCTADPYMKRLINYGIKVPKRLRTVHSRNTWLHPAAFQIEGHDREVTSLVYPSINDNTAVAFINHVPYRLALHDSFYNTEYGFGLLHSTKDARVSGSEQRARSWAERIDTMTATDINTLVTYVVLRRAPLLVTEKYLIMLSRVQQRETVLRRMHYRIIVVFDLDNKRRTEHIWHNTSSVCFYRTGDPNIFWIRPYGSSGTMDRMCITPGTTSTTLTVHGNVDLNGHMLPGNTMGTRVVTYVGNIHGKDKFMVRGNDKFSLIDIDAHNRLTVTYEAPTRVSTMYMIGPWLVMLANGTVFIVSAFAPQPKVYDTGIHIDRAVIWCARNNRLHTKCKGARQFVTSLFQIPT